MMIKNNNNKVVKFMKDNMLCGNYLAENLRHLWTVNQARKALFKLVNKQCSDQERVKTWKKITNGEDRSTFPHLITYKIKV